MKDLESALSMSGPGSEIFGNWFGLSLLLSLMFGLE